VSALRVVLDTNILVSAIAYPGSIPGRIFSAWQRGQLDVVLSRYILDEMERVLPRFAQVKLSASGIRDLADSFMFRAEMVEPVAVREASLRDEADAPILGTLLAAKADYLITGDKDLLALSERYPIVTPAAFWERHGG
jgi:putative PIN family toxin of toxin-antitoxin system